MLILGCDVTAIGPIAELRADGIVQRALEDIEEKLGSDGVARLRAYLPSQYMYLGHHGGTPETNPIPANAGELQAAIHYERVTAEVYLVVDTPVTYGAWIEGISPLNMVIWKHRRNPPARRFPGYHAFRIIGQQLEAEAGSIAESHMQPYIGELNG